MAETIKFRTRRCMECNKSSVVELDKAAFEAWQRDTHVQVAFPNMKPEDREVLISGTHPACWKKMFG